MHERRLVRGMVALFVVGAALRIWQTALRGSLWTDEAGLGLNLVGRGFSEIARPWVYAQAAPYLFVLTEKLSSVLLGESDFALRLLPLIASIVMLPLIALVARELSGLRAACIALALATAAEQLIHYAQELKPYSLDGAVAAALVLLGLRAAKGRRRELHVLGALGVLAPWFSLPAVFTLAGVGAALLAEALWPARTPAEPEPPRDVRRALVLAGYGAAWLVSFVVQFKGFLQVVVEDTGMQAYYEVLDTYAPFPPRSFSHLRWYVGHAAFLFAEPGSFRLYYLAGAVFLAGAVIVARERRFQVLMFVLPWLCAFGASAARHYVIEARLMLYLVPSMCVLIAVALDRAFSRAERPLRIAAAVVLALLLVSPVRTTLAELRTAPERPGMEDLVLHLVREHRAGDGLYVDEQTHWVFDFYARRHELGAPRRYAPADDVENPAFGQTIDSFGGRARVWALSPTLGARRPDTPSAAIPIRETEARIVARLDALGRQLARYDGGNAALYLYDLSASAR